MTDPFELLGIEPTTDVEEVRRAYHNMARKYHPDQFQDAERQEAANQRMVALNQAYEEALKLASSRSNTPYREVLPCEEALELARTLLDRGIPEGALRALLRSDEHTADWYSLQGQVLMQMEQYESAQQSFREAIRRDPSRMDYRRGALDALVAERNSKTLSGKLKKLFRVKPK